jgi:hypothetical protein
MLLKGVMPVRGSEADWAGQQADRIIATNRRAAEQLGRLRQRPFGLAPGSWQPAPARISAEAFKASPRAALALVTRAPVPRSSMTLMYGYEEDPSAVLVEVATDFSRGHEDSESLQYALWLSARRDLSPGPGDTAPPDDPDDFDGPFEHGDTSILVDGAPRRVPTLSFGQYQALRFGSGRVLVTVVTRHEAPELLSLAPVTDLSSYVSDPDGDISALREALRQRIRDQPSPGSTL